MAREIDKDKLAYGGGVGLGVAGVLTHLGLRAVDQAKALGKQHQRYEARVFDVLKNTTIGQLNKRQLDVLKYLNIDLTDVEPTTKLRDLQTGKLVDGKPVSFIDMLQGPEGYKAKVNKNDRAALIRQTAMNEFVVPVEQQIIKQAKSQTGHKLSTAAAVSQQLHDGGAAPRRSDVKPQIQNPFGTLQDPELPFDATSNRILTPEQDAPLRYTQGRNMSWINPGGMDSLRQGAAGRTQPTSSLITNQSFLFPGQQSTAAQVRGQLPPTHPSARRAPVVEVVPEQEGTPQPAVAEEKAPLRRPILPTTESSGWTGSETPQQRRAEYDEALKQRRKANKLYVPGEGVRAKLGNAGRSMVRGAINAPTASKVMYGAGAVLPMLGAVWANSQAEKQADAIDSQVRPTRPTQETTGPNTKEPKWEQAWHKDIIQKIRTWPILRGKSDADITKWMKQKQGDLNYAGSAQTWLKYYGE